ncbi:hypothetical protein GUITHDRAFT_108311 [Guillardia theta CCMP2712]|uniref:YchJ-like middle NTF2-like domain-containing protein n=1 Tax=Guillardia theta (strain CCMP2712) TaxID=905079 RepID=L1JBH7_GUITC|nr:hypothetical protein GUITHDRAFT_108311 [Guillardia theta CCMP2712]EKX45861.1 hypothetical protein GUITHDRAFT_108311 [Guillardia theta CCMP2712]|eukprot:XP_005832841.1 hypothetical protein GUITHDRAFT_108311 [Guillardia theta CCMP2712]
MMETGFFLRIKMDEEMDVKVDKRLPEKADKTMCACGSGRTYYRCCRDHHNCAGAPEDPVDLIRARYSAFAYRLPSFIIRTTSRKSKEWTKKWMKELLDFMDSYKFETSKGDPLGIEIQECIFSDKQNAYIQFQADMVGEGDRLVSFVERCKLRREDDGW